MEVVGLQAVQARIASIEARFGPTTRQPLSGSAPTSASFSQSFAQSLGSAQSQFSPTSAQGAATSPGAKQIPADLLRYGNGKIPPSALESIGIGNHRLATNAAQSFRAMRSAAAADGVNIGVTDSYRDLASQQELAKRKGLYSQGGLAAKPGTSDHGWGIATDIDVDSKGLAWMRANAGRFGFVEDVPREPWHWTFHQPAQ